MVVFVQFWFLHLKGIKALNHRAARHHHRHQEPPSLPPPVLSSVLASLLQVQYCQPGKTTAFLRASFTSKLVDILGEAGTQGPVGTAHRGVSQGFGYKLISVGLETPGR